MAKTKRSNKKLRKRNRNLGQALVLLGIISMLSSGLHWYLRLKALSFDEQVVESYLESQPVSAAQTIEPDITPTHIKIPWFVDVPIEQQVIVDGRWTISSDQASYLAQSADPGQAGNIIIYGHNTREILGNIRALKGGEVITVSASDGQEYQYQVDSIHQVSPSDLSLLLPTDQEVLTIYTCAGLLDSERFVVRAIRLDA